MTDLRLPSHSHRRLPSTAASETGRSRSRRWLGREDALLILFGLLLGAVLGGMWTVIVGGGVPPWWAILVGATVAFAAVTAVDLRQRRGTR